MARASARGIEELEREFPEGHGYFCHMYTQGPAAGASSVRMERCFRNQDFCEEVRRGWLATPLEPGEQLRPDAPCERYEGPVWARAPREEVGYYKPQHREACRGMARVAGAVCLPMGDLER